MVTSRSKEEVVKMILQCAAGKGAGISTIMFNAYLSYAQAVEYLSELMEKGLIANDPSYGRRYYRTTPEGMNLLCATKTAAL